MRPQYLNLLTLLEEIIVRPLSKSLTDSVVGGSLASADIRLTIVASILRSEFLFRCTKVAVFSPYRAVGVITEWYIWRIVFQGPSTASLGKEPSYSMHGMLPVSWRL